MSNEKLRILVPIEKERIVALSHTIANELLTLKHVVFWNDEFLRIVAKTVRFIMPLSEDEKGDILSELIEKTMSIVNQQGNEVVYDLKTLLQRTILVVNQGKYPENQKRFRIWVSSE